VANGTFEFRHKHFTHLPPWLRPSHELDRLVRDYGVDGFKLDAGDMQFYPSAALSMQSATPNKHCELYARIGLRFPLNEYLDC